MDIGERVRRARLANGISQDELARQVGLDRTMIAKIEAGSRRIDALELTMLSTALHVSMNQLLHPQPKVLSRRADRVILTGDSDSEVSRQSERLELALVAWLGDLRQLADLRFLHPRPSLGYPRPARTRADARQAATWVRDQLSLGVGPIESLMEACERAGQYVLVTELPGDGASLVDGDIAAAVVSRRGDPGRRRATAAHELGHLVLGDEYSSDLGVSASRAEREGMIDAFAAELLLPTQAVAEVATRGSISRTDLVNLAGRYRTSWSLALSQAEAANVLEPDVRRKWTQSSPTRAELLDALGWVPQPDLEWVRVPPGYAQAVMEAWRADLIASARAVELMHGHISAEDLPTRDDVDLEP
jgi:transcriptional regulator with XRE-family HTH domain/Zn-dependent peptidase ImmA (M78 family)